MSSVNQGSTRTSAWRLTLAFTLIVLLVNATLLVAVYWLTVSEREQQLQHNVLLAADTFRQLAQVEGDDGESLQRLVASHARGAANTLLALDADGAVAGNLSRLPDALPQYPDTGRFPVAVSGLSGEPAVELAQGTWIAVPGGRLMVARLEEDRGAYRRDFLVASALALALTLLLTLVAGYLFNRYQLKRLHRLSMRLEQIQLGRLETRLPSRAGGDELDVLAGQVNHMLDDIDDLLHSVAGVTDNIAHDLRTPLSRIRLRLEEATAVLARQDAPPAWLVTAMGDNQADLDQLLETFDAMLELSRLEQGILQVEGQPCELATIAADVAELLVPVAEANGQTLALERGAPVVVSGDANLLFRALYNLVDNAIRHAGDGARIVIEQHGCGIAVQDNGPGIPVAEREQVFRRLYRLDQSRQREGSGLGLSIVRAIARLHGAEVSLVDAGPGLRVTLEFNTLLQERP